LHRHSGGGSSTSHPVISSQGLGVITLNDEGWDGDLASPSQVAIGRNTDCVIKIVMVKLEKNAR
jgi:hypothetical protein